MIKKSIKSKIFGLGILLFNGMLMHGMEHTQNAHQPEHTYQEPEDTYQKNTYDWFGLGLLPYGIGEKVEENVSGTYYLPAPEGQLEYVDAPEDGEPVIIAPVIITWEEMRDFEYQWAQDTQEHLSRAKRSLEEKHEKLKQQIQECRNKRRYAQPDFEARKAARKVEREVIEPEIIEREIIEIEDSASDHDGQHAALPAAAAQSTTPPFDPVWRAPQSALHTQAQRPNLEYAACRLGVIDKEWKCSYCPDAFYYKAALRIHKSIKHGVEPASEYGAQPAIEPEKSSEADPESEDEESIETDDDKVERDQVSEPAESVYENREEKEQKYQEYNKQDIKKRERLEQKGNQLYRVSNGQLVCFVNCGRFHCSQCKKSFTKQEAFSRHFKMHDPKSEWPFACISCGERFYRKDLYRYHMKKTCPNKKRRY